MQSSLDIHWWQLAIFMLVLLVPLAVNFRFSLGLTREITLAVVRMSLQLVLVGLYLQFLFELNNPLLNLMWLMVMLLVGTSAIISSTALEAKYLYLPVLCGLLLGLVPLLLLLLLALLQPVPVYNAQYLIPLAGMLLGNSLSGNIVALQRLFTAFKDKNDEYEGALALGATPPQASLPFVQSAMQQAFAPILASMATTGLVTLPGMMTGQILGGVDPITAIKYQLVILVAIFVMLSISVTTSLYLGIRTSITPTGLVKAKFKTPKVKRQKA
ncbi:ABC transporter permease [Thalassomonas actiniarum]|uniref:ABC transporter permease n=1 Tax=Thalassomonas actiniarum TaxID=485447 RepID=A0AAF0C2I2_9GAMM|nr:ABC transporter permease [Thalassomonas actiniarum]WDE00162.1 ABC transporter permease [Thalassomonas actiniarum]